MCGPAPREIALLMGSLRAGHARPLQRYCVSSCSISSFFSGNSAAGSALKVRMPSFN